MNGTRYSSGPSASAKAGVLASDGEYAAAEEEIRTALRLDPDSVDVLREAGRLSFMLRRYAEAAAYWEKQSNLVDSDFAVGGLLITCYTALGDKANVRRVAQRTLARAEKIIAVDGDNGSAMAAMFSCLLCLGEGDRAKEWAKRAVYRSHSASLRDMLMLEIEAQQDCWESEDSREGIQAFVEKRTPRFNRGH